MQAILHPQTSSKLANYLKRPTHGILLTGKEGAGKLHLAKRLASELGANSLIIETPEDKATISIDQIRELYGITRTGTPLIIIIKDAHLMGVEAQNAFLKLLEEPPENTKFILTAELPTSLLPTIRSRSQLIEVLPPRRNELINSITSSELTQPQLESLLHTSEGLAGAFFTLTEPEQYRTHQANVELAKKFYTATPHQRHLICIEQKYEKAWSEELLRLLAIIVRSLLKNATDQKLKSKLIAQSTLLEVTAYSLFKINGNSKIHLAKLCQQLG